MFGMALSLWMIDIHNVIIEIQLTLLSTTADSLDDAYGVAVSQVLRLASVEDVLYAYMVGLSKLLCLGPRFNIICRPSSGIASSFGGYMRSGPKAQSDSF